MCVNYSRNTGHSIKTGAVFKRKYNTNFTNKLNSISLNINTDRNPKIVSEMMKYTHTQVYKQ